MKILDCNKPEELYNNCFTFDGIIKPIKVFERGSRIYLTNHKGSDYDYGVIVPNEVEIIDVEGVFENEKSDKRIHPCTFINPSNNDRFDFEIVKSTDFNELVLEHDPFAIEAMILNNWQIYADPIKLNPWKLRCKFGQIANNSWSKAKKKMTVEKDLDMYCGVKSLFHSIRLQMFACYFVKGYITNDERKSVIDLFNEIKHDWTVNNFTWEDFKNKYKPIYNYWHSEMVKCCTKPEEEFKNNKK